MGRYGIEFLDVIKKYAAEHAIEGEKSPAEEIAASQSVLPSHVVTYNMYIEGLPLKEIAKTRELTSITVENHIIRCAQEGYDIDYSSFIPSKYENLILEKIKELGPIKLKPIKEALPDEIDYLSIRAVISKYKAEFASEGILTLPDA